jgi:hypothetical protein
MLRRGGSSELTDLRLIREQLVLIWNARGAADIAALEAELLMRGRPGPASRRTSIARCAGWIGEDPAASYMAP